MPRKEKPLFVDHDLLEHIRSWERQMYGEIDSLSSDYLLGTNVDALCDYFEEKYKLTVPIVKSEAAEADQSEAQIDVSQDRMRFISNRSRPFYITGTAIIFYVPFEGDSELFYCRPSTWTTISPYATVGKEEITLRYESTDQDAEKARAFYDRNISQIQQYLQWVSGDVEPYNRRVREHALTKIESRRSKLLKDKGMTESLGIPLRKREGVPQTYTAPTVRKKVTVARPPQGAAPNTPEPTLDMDEYEHILSVISNMAKVIERSPDAFRQMNEENLREHFLVQLNGHYEGQATGETFNFQGKTDILIRWEGKNLFIAECKFWKGPESLKRALDQLLGYTTWRDTKTALLLFNRQKNFSTLLQKIPEIVKEHGSYKQGSASEISETNFRFTLLRPDDESRELTLTVMTFDVPSE